MKPRQWLHCFTRKPEVLFELPLHTFSFSFKMKSTANFTQRLSYILVINNIPAPVTDFINTNISPLSLHLILEKNHILELQTCVQTFKSSSSNAFLTT